MSIDELANGNELRELSARGMVSKTEAPDRDIRSLVSAEEWHARVELAACYRLMVKYGMTDMIYNHITLRVPGEPTRFLINAYGLHYSEITASSLHKVDHDGEIVLRANTHYGINHPGFVIHSAIHRARRDVNCVIHTHTRAGVAVSAMKCGLLPLSLNAMRFCHHIGYHDCQGTVVDIEEQESIVRSIGEHNALVLRNHGLITCGQTAGQAFNAHYALDSACKTQVDALSAGIEGIQFPTDEVVARTGHLFQPNVRRPYGDMEWETLIRLLDREDQSYRS